MRVYHCEHEWEAMLTCVYEAFNSKLGHKNIRLTMSAVDQYNLFDEHVEIVADHNKAIKVMDSVNQRISRYVYDELAFCSMSKEEDVLDNIYRIMILGFHYGAGVLDMLQFKDVMRNREIRIALGREVNHFIEFSRFHDLGGQMLIAHIEPKSKLIQGLAFHFSDRMPSENWMIIDDVHKEAIIHPKDEKWYLRQLSQEDIERLLLSENINDEYTDMWKLFFRTIAINERENYECQRNLFPIWTRKHAVEFL